MQWLGQLLLYFFSLFLNNADSPMPFLLPYYLCVGEASTISVTSAVNLCPIPWQASGSCCGSEMIAFLNNWTSWINDNEQKALAQYEYSPAFLYIFARIFRISRIFQLSPEFAARGKGRWLSQRLPGIICSIWKSASPSKYIWVSTYLFLGKDFSTSEVKLEHDIMQNTCSEESAWV